MINNSDFSIINMGPLQNNKNNNKRISISLGAPIIFILISDINGHFIHYYYGPSPDLPQKILHSGLDPIASVTPLPFSARMKTLLIYFLQDRSDLLYITAELGWNSENFNSRPNISLSFTRLEATPLSFSVTKVH